MNLTETHERLAATYAKYRYNQEYADVIDPMTMREARVIHIVDPYPWTSLTEQQRENLTENARDLFSVMLDSGWLIEEPDEAGKKMGALMVFKDPSYPMRHAQEEPTQPRRSTPTVPELEEE